jgi:hypothetical protein
MRKAAARVVSDPVANGLIASFARPGGNLAGFTLFNVELTAKRLEFLSELVPQARSIALLVNPNNPQVESVITSAGTAARAKWVPLSVLQAGTENQIDAAFARLAELHARARRSVRSIFWELEPATRCAGLTVRRPRDLCVPAVCRFGRLCQLWTKPHFRLSASGDLCRQNPQG